MEIKTNLNQVIIELDKMISPEMQDALVKEVASKIEEATVKRIFVNGLDVNDEKIGRYKDKYAKFRKRRGRQTSFVDLFLTGELAMDWQMSKIGPAHYGIGFVSDYGKIGGYNEEHFGKTIFGISKNEEALVEETVQNFLNKLTENTR